MARRSFSFRSAASFCSFFAAAAAFFAARGWKHSLLELEALPLLEQARAFVHARLVLGLHGAALSSAGDNDRVF